jgi:hypothetical protein
MPTFSKAERNWAAVQVMLVIVVLLIIRQFLGSL